MSVPAFLVQAFQPSALPTRFVLGALHQQALSDAGIRRSNRPLAAPRRRYLRVSLEDGDAASAAGGKSWEEPTLEEEYDAIDDVIMGRQPGQGKLHATASCSLACACVPVCVLGSWAPVSRLLLVYTYKTNTRE